MIRFLAGVIVALLAIDPSLAQVTSDSLTKASVREYLAICALPENAKLCRRELTRASITLLAEGTPAHCPPEAPKLDVGRAVDWLKARPALYDKPSGEALLAALKGLYPCR
jgi:hypothetical protein